MSKIKWIVTKDPNWLDKWDTLQLSHESGMFTQTSTWLSSYQPYGFDFELLLGVNSDNVIEVGFGNLIVKAGPFKIYNCPWGPWHLKADLLDEALKAFVNRASEIGAFACQVNPAFLTESNPFAANLNSSGFQKGDLLNKIYSPVHFNIISIPACESSELEAKLLKSFSENAKRNIKSGLKNGVEMIQANSPEEVKLAYTCFEQNAEREGYQIRDFVDVGPALTASVMKGNAIIFLAKHEGEIVGAIWVAKGGRMLSYIMGGVERAQKDLKVGHLLQWTCILEAAKLGYSQYNISVGGSDGVVRFKSSFYPQQVSSAGPYSLPLSKWKYASFKLAYPFLEKNKKTVAKFLKLLR
ncbi:lipid II:glycine glycyltransferase FemX [Algoriphagus litoralis]|uniref:lipid II:glycine glycyltransferase FemX n=1 Tax=Algoriphagus litoralis TaxID=2202829 RepID=UPI000DBA86BB|nr:peptidoglycan bridge formation glycyltransferase FemA/FemB family protein [Algoriphagus litoralis]